MNFNVAYTQNTIVSCLIGIVYVLVRWPSRASISDFWLLFCKTSQPFVSVRQEACSNGNTCVIDGAPTGSCSLNLVQYIKMCVQVERSTGLETKEQCEVNRPSLYCHTNEWTTFVRSQIRSEQNPNNVKLYQYKKMVKEKKEKSIQQ